MLITRRDWLQGVLASAAAFQRTGAYRGVTLGAQSYSFRDLPLDAAIAAMSTLGLVSCELWQGHLEPKNTSREEMRRWRETTPISFFTDVKSKFDRAGVRISAYNIGFRDDFSDAEIDRAFKMARALGTTTITSSAHISVVPRVAPVAARRKITVGVHNYSRTGTNEFATPEEFVAAIAQGPFIAVNLDIGHFTAANFDAVAFLKQHHDRIVSIHIKDRKRNDGPNVPFGEGDTPIVAVLQMVRDQKWPIPVNIEYEYKGGDTVDEVRRCLAYCRKALDA